MGYTIRDFIESNKFPVVQLISDNSEMNREIKGVRMIVVYILTQHEYIRQKRNHVEYIKKINILDQCKFTSVHLYITEDWDDADTKPKNHYVGGDDNRPNYEKDRFDIDKLSEAELKQFPNLKSIVLMTTSFDELKKLCEGLGIEASLL